MVQWTKHSSPAHQLAILKSDVFSLASLGTTSITASGDFTLGSEFELTCTVLGVSPAPNIVWNGPQGLIDFSTPEIQLGEIITSGESSSRSLLFTSLGKEQTGTYSCFNTATLPGSIRHIVFLGSKSIIIIIRHASKIRMLYILMLNHHNYSDRSIETTKPIVINEPFAASCQISVPPDLEATVIVTFMTPTRELIGLNSGSNAAQSTFVIPRLQESNLGDYICQASVYSYRLNSPVTVMESFSVQLSEF